MQAERKFTDAEGEACRVAVSLGPEHGTVGPDHVKEATKEATKEAMRGAGGERVRRRRRGAPSGLLLARLTSSNPFTPIKGVALRCCRCLWMNLPRKTHPQLVHSGGLGPWLSVFASTAEVPPWRQYGRVSHGTKPSEHNG